MLAALVTVGAASRPTPQQSQEQAKSSAAQSETVRQPDLPQRVRVSQAVEKGLCLKRAAPKYPRKARNKGIQGTVLLQVIISKTGDVTTIELISGEPLLAAAAIDAVKQWKYKPYLLQGNPVEIDTQVQLNFTLSGN